MSEQSLITLIISSEIIVRFENLSLLLQRCGTFLRYVIIIKPQEYNDRDGIYVKAVCARASHGSTGRSMINILGSPLKLSFRASIRSVCKSRLIHRTKVNEFFSRQETRVKRASLRGREPIGHASGMAPCLGTVSVIAQRLKR